MAPPSNVTTSTQPPEDLGPCRSGACLFPQCFSADIYHSLRSKASKHLSRCPEMDSLCSYLLTFPEGESDLLMASLVDP
ncbi:hypothetical protein I79_000606 [Cricetulus griseus]|uniref:Uncharacterized protein n=1 Tax=Cricetulus griseus TaxID=10029 RepID=G3GSJ1_CRIGR|nr:hypothetical protein I79_000606 [Cricetulus griseus]